MSVDTRTAEGVYATRDNIVAPTRAAGGPLAVFSSLPEVFQRTVADAATVASSVVTDDASAAPVDTGPVPAGDYAYFLKARHPSTAAANRSVILEHRNAANAATVRTLGTLLSDGPTGEARTLQGRVTLAAGERIRLITGSDVTHANIQASLRVVAQQ